MAKLQVVVLWCHRQADGDCRKFTTTVWILVFEYMYVVRVGYEYDVAVAAGGCVARHMARAKRHGARRHAARHFRIFRLLRGCAAATSTRG